MREDLGGLREQMQSGFAEVRGALDATAAGQQQVAALLTRMIDQGGSPE